MVCHWSRRRPVFSASGIGGIDGMRGAFLAHRHEARAPAGVGKAAIGHQPFRCAGAFPAAGQSAARSCRRLRRRLPPVRRCRTAARPCSRTPKAPRARGRSPQDRRNRRPRQSPCGCATSQMMRQSARASPGIGRNGLWRDSRRSEFVTMPSFSPQPAAGNSTSA